MKNKYLYRSEFGQTKVVKSQSNLDDIFEEFDEEVSFPTMGEYFEQIQEQGLKEALIPKIGIVLCSIAFLTIIFIKFS